MTRRETRTAIINVPSQPVVFCVRGSAQCRSQVAVSCKKLKQPKHSAPRETWRSKIKGALCYASYSLVEVADMKCNLYVSRRDYIERAGWARSYNKACPTKYGCKDRGRLTTFDTKYKLEYRYWREDNGD